MKETAKALLSFKYKKLVKPFKFISTNLTIFGWFKVCNIAISFLKYESTQNNELYQKKQKEKKLNLGKKLKESKVMIVKESQ